VDDVDDDDQWGRLIHELSVKMKKTITKERGVC